MKIHSKVYDAGVTWTIYYPSTEIELDTSVPPHMSHSDCHWAVHYVAGSIVCLSALATLPTPYVPVEAMKAYIEVVEDWEREQEEGQ